MKIARWIAVAAALSLLMLPALATAGHDTYEEAFAAAQAEGKPLLIDFFATWCGPCKTFNRDSTEDADIRKSLESFVVFKIDAEKGAGIELAKTHHVRSYPTYSVLNADGAIIDQWAGYEKPMFLDKATSALADPTTIEEKMARFASAPTLTDAETLATYYFASSDFTKSAELYARANEMNPDESYGFAIAQCAYRNHRYQRITAEEMRPIVLAFMEAEDSNPSELLSAAQLMLSSFSKDPAQAVPFLELAVARTEGMNDPKVLATRARVMPDYALYVLKDSAKAVEYKKASYPEGWQEDPDDLNGFAWWCFENDLNLEEAQEMAMKGVSLAAAGSDRGQILDTLAEICNAMGNCGEALDYMLQARDEDPESEYYKKQVERFEKILAEKEQG